MAQAFKLPDLGEGIHEGEIRSVLVSVGDRVQEGQPILEVETDKAQVEIPCPFTGVVEDIKVKPDDVVKVGTVLMVFDEGGAGRPESNGGGAKPEAVRESRERAASAPAKREAAAPPAAADVRPAAPSTSVAEAPASGTSGGSTDRGASKRQRGPVPASPATRRLARELGVELWEVAGTGPAGLVTAEDVRGFAAARTSEAGEARVLGNGHAHVAEPPATLETPSRSPGPEVLEPPPLPDFSRWGPVERVAMRSVRRATARNMALAWSQIPHATHQDLADMTRLEEYRRKHAPEVEAAGGKLTLTVFVMKAAVAALKMHPRLNSSLDPQAEEIVLKRYYHLGVAADTERGLIVPVIRDVDRKSLTELAVELKVAAERARAGETSLEEMQRGTFTITNIGALGGTGFVPIVNYPQVAILGMGRAKLQPVVLGDLEDYQIVPRLMMPLVLGFDHRVLDGADAARFVRTMVEALEEPERLWLRI